MTRRERVLTALAHKQPDCAPWNIELTSPEQTRVCDHLGIAPAAFFDMAGNHIEKADYNIGGSTVRPGFFRDEFGVVWNRSGMDKDIGVIDEIILKEPTLGGFSCPAPRPDAVRAASAKLLGNGHDTLKLGKIGMTLFERAWSLRGLEDMLMDFHLNQEFVRGLLERILEYNCAIIETACETEIDGFYFGDDYGQQTGMIMSPDTWRAFIKPCLARMFSRVKAAGKIIALHSCGNISAILGDLIDIGLDAYQTVQPEIYDLRTLKREFGSRLTFWGAISTQQTLPYVAPGELKRIVRETIGILGCGGGYICAPTHRVPDDVPAENIVALIEALKEQETR